MENEEYINGVSAASQCGKILDYIKKHGSITSLEAIEDEEIRCMRLASRIHDLKDKGWDIVSRRIKTKSGKYVAQYSLT